MDTIYFDPDVDDTGRRELIYNGQLIVYSPNQGSLALIEHAREMIHGAFGTEDPETAQFDMEVEEYARVLADLKPRFIHHPRSKECIREMLDELGCDIDRTYFDVPRMRSSTASTLDHARSPPISGRYRWSRAIIRRLAATDAG